MIEDYKPNESNFSTPLSSVALQFLVLFVAPPPVEDQKDGAYCFTQPQFVSPPTPREGQCLGIPAGQVYKGQLAATTGADKGRLVSVIQGVRSTNGTRHASLQVFLKSRSSRQSRLLDCGKDRPRSPVLEWNTRATSPGLQLRNRRDWCTSSAPRRSTQLKRVVTRGASSSCLVWTPPSCCQWSQRDQQLWLNPEIPHGP